VFASNPLQPVVSLTNETPSLVITITKY
jgi:hypothetical protein